MVVGQTVELPGDVVAVAASGILNSTTGNEFVHGSSTSLQFHRLVLGAGDRHADVAHLLIKTCEGLVDAGLGFSCGVGSFDGLFLGAEGIHSSLEALRPADEFLFLSLQGGMLGLQIIELGLQSCLTGQRLTGEILTTLLECPTGSVLHLVDIGL